MAISSCLTYLGGDEAKFSAVYACFVAIKYLIKTLNHSVVDAFLLNDNDIDHMITLIHQRLATIFLKAYGVTFETDPLFSKMRVSITAKFVEEFLQLERASLNQQSKAALSPVF